MRLLKANEIEVRVGSCKEKGASLLLYKNARVDMNIMDETYGPEYWKREHIIISTNNYCRVSVFNKDIKEWVSKEDCGTESMTEKEKGEASDSFKRACVNWGIGRELYTSPFIWITNIKTTAAGSKFKTFDKFKVKEITYNEDREVENLVIINQDNKEVFTKRVTVSKPPETKPSESKRDLGKECRNNIIELYGKENYVKKLQELTEFKGKDGNLVAGLESLASVSEKRIQVLHGKLKKLKEEKEKSNE